MLTADERERLDLLAREAARLVRVLQIARQSCLGPKRPHAGCTTSHRRAIADRLGEVQHAANRLLLAKDIHPADVLAARRRAERQSVPEKEPA